MRTTLTRLLWASDGSFLLVAAKIFNNQTVPNSFRHRKFVFANNFHLQRCEQHLEIYAWFNWIIYQQLHWQLQTISLSFASTFVQFFFQNQSVQFTPKKTIEINFIFPSFFSSYCRLLHCRRISSFGHTDKNKNIFRQRAQKMNDIIINRICWQQ